MLFMCAFVGVAVSCQSPSDEPSAQISGQMQVPSYAEDTAVVIKFINPEIFVQPMTRADVSSAASHLDMWLTDGTTITEIHQASTDVDFGTASVTLNKTKTYTLYAVAHKCDGPAMLDDGIISWPDDKIKDSFWYTTTFSPTAIANLNCEMSRIVAMFRIETTDAVPTEAKKLRITQGGVYDRWDVTTGATHQIDRISTISISSTNSDGTISLSVYSIAGDSELLHTITVEALDADDQPIQTHTFSDVPLRANHKTIFRGAFFTDQGMSMVFSVGDWVENTPISF